MGKKHYKEGPPQRINIDLPHLRDNGEWRAKGGLPKKRMEGYLGWLKELGMTDADAQGMMGDLYWDCCSELAAAGLISFTSNGSIVRKEVAQSINERKATPKPHPLNSQIENTKQLTPRKKEPVRKKPKPILFREVSKLKMVAGNEKKFLDVIHDGELKHWVGIGWVVTRKATKEDYFTYPEVVG